MALVRVALALAVAVLVMVPRVAAQQLAPDAVVEAYAAARVRGDVDGLLVLFAPDAAVTDRFGGVHVGVNAIRELLQLNVSRGAPATVVDRRVNGAHVSWVERVNGRGTTFSLNVDAVVQRGRIQSLAFGGGGVEPAPLATSPSAAGLPAPLGLATVVLVFVTGVLAVSLSPLRPPPSGSRLCGALLPALRRWSQERPGRGAAAPRAPHPGQAS